MDLAQPQKKKDSKKRKIVDEKRVFNENWTEKYFFIEINNKTICIICMEIISVLKVYNLKRHYTQRHAATFDGIQGMIRSDKIAELKRLMTAQQLSFKKVAIQNDSIVKASYVVANLIAKKSKPFSDGEFIKQCIEDVVGIICPDKKNE